MQLDFERKIHANNIFNFKVTFQIRFYEKMKS